MHSVELDIKKNSGYKTKLVYKCRDKVKNPRIRNNRIRKILWLMLPKSMTVANKIIKEKKTFLYRIVYTN